MKVLYPFVLIVLLVCSCSSGYETADFEHFVLKYPRDMELSFSDNDENVMFTLKDEGFNLIVQNNFDAISPLYRTYEEEDDIFKYLHALKFDSWFTDHQGYSRSEVTLHKINGIPYSHDYFLKRDRGMEFHMDNQIVKLGESYYPFYLLGKNDLRYKNRIMLSTLLLSIKLKDDAQ